MLYSCVHMATVGVKGLTRHYTDILTNTNGLCGGMYAGAPVHEPAAGVEGAVRR